MDPQNCNEQAAEGENEDSFREMDRLYADTNTPQRDVGDSFDPIMGQHCDNSLDTADCLGVPRECSSSPYPDVGEEPTKRSRLEDPEAHFGENATSCSSNTESMPAMHSAPGLGGPLMFGRSDSVLSMTMEDVPNAHSSSSLIHQPAMRAVELKTVGFLQCAAAGCNAFRDRERVHYSTHTRKLWCAKCSPDQNPVGAKYVHLSFHDIDYVAGQFRCQQRVPHPVSCLIPILCTACGVVFCFECHIAAPPRIGSCQHWAVAYVNGTMERLGIIHPDAIPLNIKWSPIVSHVEELLADEVMRIINKKINSTLIDEEKKTRFQLKMVRVKLINETPHREQLFCMLSPFVRELLIQLLCTDKPSKASRPGDNVLVLLESLDYPALPHNNTCVAFPKKSKLSNAHPDMLIFCVQLYYAESFSQCCITTQYYQ